MRPPVAPAAWRCFAAILRASSFVSGLAADRTGVAQTDRALRTIVKQRDRAGGKGHARCYRRHGAGVADAVQLNIGVPGASSLYGAPSNAEQVSAETEQLPDFATHRLRMLWRML